MTEDGKRPKIRRAEIISGISIAVALPILGFAWNIRNDLQKIIESSASQVRIECLTQLEQERQRAREREQELSADIRELRTNINNLRSRR